MVQMEEIKTITVEIFGREYKIKGFADEKYIVKVAKFVHDRMTELSKSASMASHEKLAILAALNITDELFREKESMSETFSLIEQKSDELIQRLDGNLLVED